MGEITTHKVHVNGARPNSTPWHCLLLLGFTLKSTISFDTSQLLLPFPESCIFCWGHRGEESVFV